MKTLVNSNMRVPKTSQISTLHTYFSFTMQGYNKKLTLCKADSKLCKICTLNPYSENWKPAKFVISHASLWDFAVLNIAEKTVCLLGFYVWHNCPLNIHDCLGLIYFMKSVQTSYDLSSIANFSQPFKMKQAHQHGDYRVQYLCISDNCTII